MVESLNYDTLLDSLADVFDNAVACNNEPGWEEYASEGSFAAYRRTVEGGATAIKVELFFDRAPKDFADHLFSNAGTLAKKHTPDLVESSEVVRRFDDDAIILHDKLLPQGPVSAREIYMFSAKAELSNGDWAILSASPEGIPATEGYIQAQLHFSLYLFEKIAGDPNRTNFTVINCLDPKGSIPQVIVNSVSAKRAYFFKHLVDDYLATTNKT